MSVGISPAPPLGAAPVSALRACCDLRSYLQTSGVTANPDSFYGAAQAAIHHERFGDLARDAARTLAGLLASRGLTDGTVVDLGCGSGILAGVLADLGYDVRGFDLSPAMIELAERNAPKARFRVGSLLDVEFPPCVAVTSIGEALNYATDDRAGESATIAVAQRVHDALVPGGVFLFDVATPGRNLGQDVRERVHVDDDWVLAMRATEDGDRLDRNITIFTRGPDARYDRVDEHHVTRLFDPARLQAALEGIGFAVETRPSYGADRSDSTPPMGWTVFVASRPSA
jgi:SAM-dependent methyltransferase